MSEPEISRRCFACGASVRQRALFCPQCGNGMTNRPATQEKASDSASSTIEDPETLTAKQSRKNPDTAALTSAGAQTVGKPSMNDRDTVRTASGVARVGSEGNFSGRVEKLRKVSAVVIDQAGYDPSLRFLLVAGALFLLFLLLLILSKVIR